MFCRAGALGPSNSQVELRDRQIGFTSLSENLDITTPGGRLVFHVFAALAEFIRELIVQGTREGLAAARAWPPPALKAASAAAPPSSPTTCCAPPATCSPTRHRRHPRPLPTYVPVPLHLECPR